MGVGPPVPLGVVEMRAVPASASGLVDVSAIVPASVSSISQARINTFTTALAGGAFAAAILHVRVNVVRLLGVRSHIVPK